MNDDHDDSKNGYLNNQNQTTEEFEGQEIVPDNSHEQHVEQYAEPQNDFYTTEYNQENYFNPNDAPAQQDDAYAQQEASIFGEQLEPDFVATDDLYSTELPSQNYTSAYTNADNNYANHADQGEYTAVENENGVDYQAEQEQYVNAEQYAEPAQYAEQAYDTAGYEEVAEETDYVYENEQAEIEPVQYETDTNYYEPNQIEYAETQQQINADLVADDYTEYDEGGNQEYYNEQTQNEQNFVTAPVSSRSYDGGPADQGFVAQQNSNEFEIQNANYSHNEAPNLHQQNFAQEYLDESNPQKGGLPIGWMVSGAGVVAILVGIYFGYSSLNSTDGQMNVPFVEADKSDIKIVPKTEKSDVKIGSNTAEKNIAELPQTPDETVLNSRETVIEQPIKTDDRVEISTNVNIDNDDKDIQNVLTLLKSNVNNAEILLKPDEINVIDQNKIGVEGLKTTLVDAKQVSLNNVNGNKQVTEAVATAGVDDLVVIGEGNDDPFKQVIDSEAVDELPDVAPQPLPEVKVANLDLTSQTAQEEPSDILTQVVKQIITDAPKPIKRPVVRNVTPTVVPNSLTPNAVAGGDYGVQLASLPTEAGARQAYVKALKQFPNILASFSPVIKEAVVPGKGVFYRVFAGPLNNYSDANELCATLRASGISGCFARKM